MDHQGKYRRLLGQGVRKIARVALVIGLGWISPPSQATVGAIPGSFAVSETGAATYTIPIAVPPGTAGMEPKLALSYNSQGGNGLLGVGWSLSGLSAITRCPQTMAQDGVRGGVNLNSNDRFCIDGQRFMVISGVYGADGAEYRTELESYSRIISYGVAGNGPAYFKVWTKSGQVMEYGVTADSRIEAQGKTTTLVWALNKVQDTAGNYLTVTYLEDNANGQYYPARVDYSGNSKTDKAPTNSVQFSYETRPDITPMYQAGALMRNMVRLSTVRSFQALSLNKHYTLTYEAAGILPRTRLVSLTECGADNTCLSSTTFLWQHENTGFPLSASVAMALPPTINGYITSNNTPAYATWGDFNGDGKQDYMWIPVNGDGRWLIAYSTGSGFAIPDYNNPALPSTINGYITSNNTPAYATWGDFNGDGKQDYMWIPVNGDGRWLIAYSTGSGFAIPDYNNPALPSTINGYITSNNTPAYATWGDFNGDGKQDYMWIPVNGDGRWLIAYSTGNGFAIPDYNNPALPSTINGYITSNITSSYARWGDFNGDGRLDYMWIPPAGPANGDGRWLIAYSTGSGFAIPDYNNPALPSTINGNITSNNTPAYATWGDFNGDGKQDYMWVPVNGDGRWSMLQGPMGQPKLLMGITTGLGAITNITYKPLTDTSVYIKETGGAYPTLDLEFPLYVVSSSGASDGARGSYALNYTYRGLKADLTGRGFLGFRAVESTDVQTGIVSRTEYRQDFPYTGLPVYSEKRLNGVLLSQADTVYDLKTFGTGAATRYFPYAQQSVETGYELDGSQVTQTTTSQTYDDWGNPTQIVVSTDDGYSKTTTNTYTNDSANWILGRLTRASVASTIPGWQGAATRTSAFEYDAASGLLTKEIVEPDTPSLRLDTAYAYDAYGNKTAVTVSSPATGDAAIVPRTSTTGYDAQGRFPITSSNALGHSENRIYDPRFGKVTSLTGPNGLTTTWQYDGFGRKTREDRSDLTYTTWSYEACGTGCPPYAQYYVVTQTPGAPEARVYYDMHNREVRSATVGFDGRWVNKDTEYDVNGRVSRVSRPYYDNEPAQWTTSYYDELGRPYQIDDPDGGITRRSYQGLTTITTNPKGQTKTEVKNSQGQLVSVADADNYATTYAYDAYGSLFTTTAAGNTIWTIHDPRGRKIYMNDPDMGWRFYTYNALGELVRQTDAKNQTVTNTYDKLGRLTQRAEPDLVTTWYYDQYKGGGLCAMGIGKLCEISADNNTGQRIYYEGQGGRISVVTHTIDTTYSAYRSYDAQGRASTQSVNAVFATRNVYNTNGYLAELRRDSDNALLWRADTLDASGHVTRETFGNGVTTDRAYNAQNGRLTSIQANGPNGAVQNQTYAYDSLGNLETRADTLLGSSETFTYDSLNRLTAATLGATTTTVAYDAQGNITHKSDVGAYSYTGGKPHAVTQAGANTYTYDANGNQLTGAGRTLGWTSYNLPNQIVEASGTTTFLYDYNHVRAKQTSPGKTVIYLNPRIDLGGHYHKEVAGTVTTESFYFYAGGQVVGAYVTKTNASPQTHYFHGDHLGSISVVTDQAGQVITRYQYDPWGKRVLAAGSTATMHGYTGHEHLDDGLIHMNGRVYDPGLGRFLSADPTIPDATNLQAYNRYSYVFNNPLSLTDPSGFRPFWKQRWFRQVVGAGLAFFAGPIAYNAGFWGVGTALGGGTAGLIGGTLAGGALAGMTTQLLTTGSANGWQKAGLSAMMFFGAGEVGSRFGKYGAEHIAAHAAAGCASSALYGGDCGSGALSGMAGMAGDKYGLIASAVVGGTASVIGGGKFANGARSAAFGYLYNCWMHPGCWGALTQRVSVWAQSLWVRYGPSATALAADLAGVNGTLSTTPVVSLGHSPEYVELAKRYGYEYFNTGKAYDAFGGLQNNFRFLDYMAERGATFMLSPIRRLDSVYVQELQYMREVHSLVPNAEHTQLVHKSELIPK